MREDDLSFFRRRALQEQVAAQRAATEAARVPHDKLATMYRFRASMLSKPTEGWSDALTKKVAAEAAEATVRAQV
jgi:hypothetical protein